MAPIGCSVSVDTNSPTAPRAASPQARYAAARATRSNPSPKPIWVPDSSVIEPPPKRGSPITMPTTATVNVATKAPTVIAASLTMSSRSRVTGTARR